MPKRFIIIFAFLLFTFYFSSSAFGGWYKTTVDSTGNVGIFSSLDLDSNNYPHIAYYNSTGTGSLKYAKWTGSTWEIQTVDSTPYVGYYPSIALDSSNRPYIAHATTPDGDGLLRCVSWEGLSWNTQILPGGSIGRWNSIALDSLNRPHISYYDDGTYYLMYASWEGSNWVTQTVDPTNNYVTSIALDSSNNPHISYYVTLGNLRYASLEGSTWKIQTVDSAGNVGACPSIALESITNYPHISYYDSTNGDLKYARWTGAPTWEIQTVDTGGTDNVGDDTSIALDSNNYSHISYYDETNKTLKYARWTGSTWEVQTVDYIGNSGTWWAWRRLTSMKLDDKDCPHISYYDGTNGHLRYAIFDSTFPTVTVESPNGGESFKGGSVQNITWTATDNFGLTVTLKYSTDEGTSWTLIESGRPNNGTYSWTVPLINTTKARISIEAEDFAGNAKTDMSIANFAIDSASPIISNVKFDGKPYVYGNIISPTPLITAIITDPSSVDATYYLKLDFTGVQSTIECTTTYKDIGAPLSYEVTATPKQPIGGGKYNMGIMGRDLGSPQYEGIGWSGAVEVTVGPVQAIGPILTYPTPFRPLKGEILIIAYNLSTDADITIYMYSTGGEVVKTWRFIQGEVGGKAGYNAIEWNGVTDFGYVIGNGMYVFKIVSGNRIIGSGRIVVYD